MKNFDIWNNLKKFINSKEYVSNVEEAVYFAEREIWFAYRSKYRSRRGW